MAVAQKVGSRLTLILDDGDDMMTGETIFKSKSFNNVKPEATADQLFTIAAALAELQERPLYNVERTDDYEITQQ
ncbi:DUF1659 domain-containing protein [Lentibacillus cibarius]|uniref:DUF1659 domain-containing protein n=1 Tax=Lentibacillus cibarius TaxID=2583219 RepID=A0A549YG66_9BACI|nr:DUF1659 domain-containing protein [Lentibacillus cibarius]TMN22107.1 DUF1659 domain-containing protein [Lentibacillus cibarius]TRM10880.1 DUF1659 domain-containing protein [Lentibacillus cibarius]